MSKQPKAYAFIDSQNLNLGIQKMRWKLDWRKFRSFLRKQYNVEKAFLFIGYLPENEDLYIQMQEAGYLVVLKPTLEMYAKPHDPEAPPVTPVAGEPEVKKPPTKGNVDAELVLYAMKELPNYDKAIIVSGDGDFYCLVEYLSEKQKLLKVLAPNWMFSSLLKPYAEYIERLDLHRRELSYRPHRTPPKRR
jgi:uncharacterized LabA/DUF88 family protein